MTTAPGSEPTSDVQRHHEVERKYDVPEGATSPDFGGLDASLLVGEPVTEELVAEYVDTPDLAVLGARCTLRRRTGGSDDGWHLKRPATGDVRVELHAPVGAPYRVPAELRAELGDVVADRPLLPLVELTTERTTIEVRGGPEWRERGAGGGDDDLLALVCDDRVHARVLRIGDERDIVWREFEVELADGADARVFDAVESVFIRAGLTPSRHHSKLAFALRDVAPLAPLSPTSDAGTVVVAALARRFGEFQANEARARTDEPDAVHQARVALRRIRSLLTAYERLFDAAETAELRDELRWAGRLLGGPRDAEVFRSLALHELDAVERDGVAADGVRGVIGTWCDEGHTEAFATFLAEVDSARWDAMHEMVVAFLVRPPFRARAHGRALGVMRRLERRAVGVVEQRADRARAKPGSWKRWHAVRKSVKTVRYALESIDSVPHARVGSERKRWKRIAKAFGTMQDAVLLDDGLTALIDRLVEDGRAPRAMPVLEEMRARARRGRTQARDLGRDRLADEV